jgi:predicted Zn-dependent protease with MMP-like domain
MDRRKFERLVDQAIRELPAEFREKLENVVVLVEDYPSGEILERMEVPPGDTLFGLYEGTPLTDRGMLSPLYPDRIWIFQKPIEDECHTEDEIREEIKTTIVHEVGHFFGLDDEYLEDLGY